MPRPTGQSKTGGRTKGTPNRRSKQLEEILHSVKLNVPERIVELLPKLAPKEEVQVLLQLMPYLYPRRKALEGSVSLGHTSEPHEPPTLSLEELNQKLAWFDEMDADMTENPDLAAAHKLIAASRRGSQPSS